MRNLYSGMKRVYHTLAVAVITLPFVLSGCGDRQKLPETVDDCFPPETVMELNGEYLDLYRQPTNKGEDERALRVAITETMWCLERIAQTKQPPEVQAKVKEQIIASREVVE